MQLDAAIPPTSLSRVPNLAKGAEKLGFDGLWSSETQHDPFLPLAMVAEHTERLHFGTAVAIGFARSPATLAYTAWDLAQASGGRFILGLGTQVKAHIERRFGMTWADSPVGKLRELIEAIRAFWEAWQTGERLNYRGQYYKLTLMSPFFNPGPIDHPDIPIFIAGVNIGMCRLAGELADGFHVHPLHSPSYLREVVLPAIAQGAKKADRVSGSVTLSVSALVASDPGEVDFVRSQIAFYSSTPSYRRVLAHHGWEDEAEQLSGLARRQAWQEMPSVIGEDMMEAFAVVAPEDELAEALTTRYNGLADRLTLYIPYLPDDRENFWKELISGFRQA